MSCNLQSAIGNQKSEARHQNGANGMSDMAGNAARVVGRVRREAPRYKFEI